MFRTCGNRNLAADRQSITFQRHVNVTVSTEDSFLERSPKASILSRTFQERLNVLVLRSTSSGALRLNIEELRSWSRGKVSDLRVLWLAGVFNAGVRFRM